MASGGRRRGRSGSQYPNRSDMRKGPNQAPQATKGQPYGQAGQQIASQQQIPLSNASAAPVPSAQAAPMAGGAGPQVIPSLSDPTARPDEPITAGLPGGPGPGPEAIKPPPDPMMRAASILNSLGATADPETKALRDLVNAHLNNQGAA